MNTDIIWSKFLEKIKEHISSLSYDIWFKDTKLHSIDNGTAVIVVPMLFQKKHLEENYLDTIIDVFTSITNFKFDFKFELENKIDEIEQEIPKQSIKDTNLNSQFTFDNFIVGGSNRFAYRASLAVAETPGCYNLFFLYGESGVGKTHLLHAIGNYIIENSNKRVLYVSSKTFVNDYCNAVRNNDKNNFEMVCSFKKKYRDVDVLIIDDIQFLSDYIKVQDGFFHTFNELYASNKQIIIASDRSVDDLKLLENKLITRFNWGLTAKISTPDFDLKDEIFYQKATEDISMEVINYLNNITDSDVKQLECAIEELKKHNRKTKINILTSENENVKRNMKQNIIPDNMVIGIKIPIKLDIDKVVDVANKVMKKIIMVMELKEKNSKWEETKNHKEEIKQDDKNLDSHIYENQSKDKSDLNDFIGEEQFSFKPIDEIEKDTNKDLKLKRNVNKDNLKTNYIIDYKNFKNENEFKKKERAIKKYNMLAYKKLLFDYYPSLREGRFLGVLISKNGEVEKYELILPTDNAFVKAHGNITLHYTVYLEKKVVVLETFTPEDVLTKGNQKELTTYKGVMVSKSHKDIDMFKINLLNSINKNC